MSAFTPKADIGTATHSDRILKRLIFQMRTPLV
jgi:hypothetical protein